MRSSMQAILATSLVAFGYLLGSTQIFHAAFAQSEDSTPSEDAVKKIGEAHEALKRAVEQLQRESRYSAVTKSVNSFAVMAGGIDVKEELEGGHGVDPETWASLYVATYELKANRVKDESLADWVDTNLLGFDNDGHLTYRNKVVRIYSVSKLRKLMSQRMVVLGEVKDQKGAR